MTTLQHSIEIAERAIRHSTMPAGATDMTPEHVTELLVGLIALCRDKGGREWSFWTAIASAIQADRVRREDVPA